MNEQYLYFGGEQVATPIKITMANEKIWSKNAKRLDNGLFVGDIIAIKKTIHIEWAHLTPAETAQINRYISDIGSSLFSVKFLDEEFNQVTKTIYAGTPSYEQWGWDSRRQLCKTLAVDLIER